MTILFVLAHSNPIQKSVKRARKMIKKAVVRMYKAYGKIMFAISMLTGGFLAWTGRDDPLRLHIG